jgi:hypothetical protein
MKGIIAYCIALLAGAFACFVWLDAREAERKAAERVGIWQAKYAEQATTVVRQIDTVKVYTNRYYAKRDTLRLTDTVQVLQVLAAADSALKECNELADSCTRFRETADSTIGTLKAQLSLVSGKGKWWERCGLSLGYGATKVGGQVLAGPQVGASCRVFP